MKRPSECNETVSAWISAIQPSPMTRRCKPCQTRPSVHCNLLKSTFYDFHWFPPPSPCLFQGHPWTVAPTHPSLFISFMHAAFSARCLQVNRLVHLPVVSSCHGGHHKRDHIYGAWLTATTKFYVQKICLHVTTWWCLQTHACFSHRFVGQRLRSLRPFQEW